ncbi:MAG: tetratricopeptide repeat protein, partial [Planctomycetota bacterium]|nr:tetratricopeptide repeat protein [Planctomycetota bacterium]
MNDTASTASKAPPALPRLDLGLRLGLGLVLALVGLAVYWPALSAEFVYDDHGLVEGNARIATVGTALQSFFEPLWGQGAGAVIDNMFWRPLTVLTLAVEKALFGLKPERFHQVSLLLHLLASWAAWRLATRLLRCPTTGWLAALLFAAHPVHVESVAWISAVNDPASALFALLSLERYFAWREGGLRGVPWAAGVLLLIGLLFKETALVVPVVAFTIDLAFRHLKLRGAEGLLDFLRAYAPWAVGALLYVVGRVVAYGSVLAGFDQASAGFGLDLGREMQLRIEILGGFLEALFVHGDPRFFRQVRPVLPHGYGPWTVAVVSSLVWLAALGAAIWQKRQLALGMLLAIPASFVLLLLKIEAAGAFPISDRFLYLTVIFAAVLVVGLIDKLAPRKATIVIGLALTVVAGLQARARVLVFEDDLSLYRAAVEAEPDNLRGRTFLGSVLFQRYKETNEKDYLDEAMFHFLKALMLGFDYGQRAPKLGADAPFIARAKELDVILNGVGRDKLELDDTVFRSGVDRMDANIGLGNCALALGQLPPEFDLDWPREIFEYILSAFPNEVRALDGLGRTYYRMGDYEKAESKFREAVDIDGTFSDAWFNLGQMLGELGRADEGRVCFDQVLRLRPGYLRALDSATRLAIDGKRYPQAEAYLQQIDQDHPGSLDAIFLRGMLRASRGDMAG